LLDTFKNLPKEKIMCGRRVEKKQEFAAYFYKVLREIEEGAMNKRLTKKRVGIRKNLLGELRD
jgi:hypothetical protein